MDASFGSAFRPFKRSIVVSIFTLLACLLFPAGQAWSTAATPVPDDLDRASARAIARMPSDTPPDRLVQLMEALDLEKGALFLLAGTDPMLVEQVLDPNSHMVALYVSGLPATELAELRMGRSVVRPIQIWSRSERDQLVEMARTLGLPGCKKLRSIRIARVPGRSMRIEIIGRKGSVEMELAAAPTPEQEERARMKLTAFFGAMPPRVTSGPGSRLPLADNSFEDRQGLGTAWKLEKSVELGSEIPRSEVGLEWQDVLDGSRCLRFHADSDTRSWYQVFQRLPVTGDTPLVLSAHFKAHHVTLERDQKRRFYMAMDFEDHSGRLLGEPHIVNITENDFGWRQVTLHARAPADASYVKVYLVFTMSGTVWVDGMTLEEGY